jgi:hypothetical protein
MFNVADNICNLHKKLPKLHTFGDKDFLGRKIMKKFIKSTLLVIGATLVTLLFMNLFLNAWDNTMTDEEIVYYLEQYSTEEKLIKLAERRNLIEKTE